MAIIGTNLLSNVRYAQREARYEERDALDALKFELNEQRKANIERRAKKAEERTDLTATQKNIDVMFKGFDTKLSDTEMTQEKLTELEKLFPKVMEKASVYYNQNESDETGAYLDAYETAFQQKLDLQKSYVERRNKLSQTWQDVEDLFDTTRGKSYDLGNSADLLKNVENLNRTFTEAGIKDLRGLDSLADLVRQKQWVTSELGYWESDAGRAKLINLDPRAKNRLAQASRAWSMDNWDESERLLRGMHSDLSLDETSLQKAGKARMAATQESLRKAFKSELEQVSEMVKGKQTDEFGIALSSFGAMLDNIADFEDSPRQWAMIDMNFTDIIDTIHETDKGFFGLLEDFIFSGDALEEHDHLTKEDKALYLAGWIQSTGAPGEFRWADGDIYIQNLGSKGGLQHVEGNRYGTKQFDPSANTERISANLKKIHYGGGGDDLAKRKAASAASRAWLLMNPDIRGRVPEGGKTMERGYKDSVSIDAKDKKGASLSSTGEVLPTRARDKSYQGVLDSMHKNLDRENKELIKLNNQIKSLVDSKMKEDKEDPTTEVKSRDYYERLLVFDIQQINSMINDTLEDVQSIEKQIYKFGI